MTEHHDENGRVRHFTDADIEALARELRNEFYKNLGRGVWSMAWRVILVAIVALAAYGSAKGLRW